MYREITMAAATANAKIRRPLLAVLINLLTCTRAHTRRLASRRACIAGAVALACSLMAPTIAAAIEPAEGQSFTGTVSEITEPCPYHVEEGKRIYNCLALTPAATIQWGDGASTAGSATRAASCRAAGAQCTFIVAGTHTYTEEKPSPAEPSELYRGSVSWTDSASSQSGETKFTASVKDDPVEVTELAVSKEGAAWTLSAKIADSGHSGSAADFTATVNWSNGEVTQALVTAEGQELKVCCVVHTSTATEPGPEVRVTINDDGGQEAKAAYSVPAPPLVTTLERPSSVSETEATLEGEVDPQGSPVRECFFEWVKPAATAPAPAVKPHRCRSSRSNRPRQR